MDIIGKLENDHLFQRRLMRGILESTGDSRKYLFDYFANEYNAHAAAEEHALCSELMKNPATTEHSRRSVAEHTELLQLIKELKNTDIDEPCWLKMFQYLVTENEHHMDEEESDLFPLAKNHMDLATLQQLGRVFSIRKTLEFAEN